MGGGQMVKWLKEAALRRTDCHGTNPALHKVDSLKEGINLIARAKGITDDKKPNIGFIIDDSSMARRPEYAKEETRLGWHNRRTDECLAIGGAESLYIALCDNRDMRGADKLEEVIKRQRATKRQQRRGKKTAPSGEKGSYIDKLKKHFEEKDPQQQVVLKARDEADRELEYIAFRLEHPSKLNPLEDHPLGPRPEADADGKPNFIRDRPQADEQLEDSIERLRKCAFLVTMSSDGNWIVVHRSSRREYSITPVRAPKIPNFRWARLPPAAPPVPPPFAPADAPPADAPPANTPPAAALPPAARPPAALPPAALPPAALPPAPPIPPPAGALAPPTPAAPAGPDPAPVVAYGISKKARAAYATQESAFLVIKANGLTQLLGNTFCPNNPDNGRKLAIWIGCDFPGKVGFTPAHAEAGYLKDLLELDHVEQKDEFTAELSRVLTLLRSNSKAAREERQRRGQIYGFKVQRIGSAKVEIDDDYVETFTSCLATMSGQLNIWRFRLSTLGHVKPLEPVFGSPSPPPFPPSNDKGQHQFRHRPANHLKPGNDGDTAEDPRSCEAGALTLPAPAELSKHRKNRYRRQNEPPKTKRVVPHLVSVRPLDPAGPSLVVEAYDAIHEPPVPQKRRSGKGAVVEEEEEEGEGEEEEEEDEDEEEDDDEDEATKGKSGAGQTTPSLKRIFPMVTSPAMPKRAVARILVESHIKITPDNRDDGKRRRWRSGAKRRFAHGRLAPAAELPEPPEDRKKLDEQRQEWAQEPKKAEREDPVPTPQKTQYEVHLARPFGFLATLLFFSIQVGIRRAVDVFERFVINEVKARRWNELGAAFTKRNELARMLARMANADQAGTGLGKHWLIRVAPAGQNPHKSSSELFPLAPRLTAETYVNSFKPFQTNLKADLKQSFEADVGAFMRHIAIEASQGETTSLKRTGFAIEDIHHGGCTILYTAKTQRQPLVGEITVLLSAVALEMPFNANFAASRGDQHGSDEAESGVVRQSGRTKEKPADVQQQKAKELARHVKKAKAHLTKIKTFVKERLEKVHEVLGQEKGIEYDDDDDREQVSAMMVDLATEVLFVRDAVIAGFAPGSRSGTLETLPQACRWGLALCCRVWTDSRRIPDFAPEHVDIDITSMLYLGEQLSSGGNDSAVQGNILKCLQENFDRLLPHLAFPDPHSAKPNKYIHFEQLEIFAEVCKVEQPGRPDLGVMEAVNQVGAGSRIKLSWKAGVIDEVSEWIAAFRKGIGAPQGSLRHFVWDKHTQLDVMRLILRDELFPPGLVPSGHMAIAPSHIRFACYKVNEPLQHVRQPEDIDVGTFFKRHVLGNPVWSQFEPAKYPDAQSINEFFVGEGGEIKSKSIDLLSHPPPATEGERPRRPPFAPPNRAFTTHPATSTLPLLSPIQHKRTRDGIPWRPPFYWVSGQEGDKVRDEATWEELGREMAVCSNKERTFVAIDPGHRNPNSLFVSVPVPTDQQPLKRKEAIVRVKGGTFRQAQGRANQAASRLSNKMSKQIKEGAKDEIKFEVAAQVAGLTSSSRALLRRRNAKLYKGHLRRVAKQVVQLSLGGTGQRSIKHVVFFVGNGLQHRGKGLGSGPRPAAALIRQYELACRAARVKATFVIVPEWYTSQMCPVPSCRSRDDAHTRIAHPKQGRTVINGMSQCTATGVVYDRDGAGAANIMTQGITFLKYGRVQYRTEKQKM